MVKLNPAPQSQPLTPRHAVRRAVSLPPTLLLLLLLGSGTGLLQGCAPRLKGIQDEIENLEPIDDLTFNDITLEQSEEDGTPLWTLEAKRATYRTDNQIAVVEEPAGLIFQDGKAVYGVEGKTGEVYNDGERIVLKGTVVVKQLVENAIVSGDELEWLPQEDRLILRNNLRGTYKDFSLKADKVEFQGQSNQMTLSGAIEAVLQNSRIRLKTDALTWFIQEERMVGDRPVVLEHFAAEDPATVIDRATGLGLQVDLASQRSTLQPEAKLSLQKPAFEISSATIIWDAKTNRVESPQPITILSRSDRTTVTAQQGVMELESQLTTLTGQVRGYSPAQEARLEADRLVWNVPQDQVEATGKVTYRRASPLLEMTGSRAVGNLSAETLEVTGDQPVKTVYVLE